MRASASERETLCSSQERGRAEEKDGGMSKDLRVLFAAEALEDDNRRSFNAQRVSDLLGLAGPAQPLEEDKGRSIQEVNQRDIEAALRFLRVCVCVCVYVCVFMWCLCVVWCVCVLEKP